MRYTIRNISLLIIILYLGYCISIDRVKLQSQNLQFTNVENVITEPKIYGKLGKMHIEIIAASARNTAHEILLEEIVTKFYDQNYHLFGDLSTAHGIFDIESQILNIDQSLSIHSDKFNLESSSCKIYINNSLVVFHKPRIEIL